MHRSASRARPLTDVQRLGAVFHSTCGTHLAGGLEPADLAIDAAIRDRLVLQHPDKHRPAGVVDAFRWPRRRQPGYTPVLAVDRFGCSHNRGGELMARV